MTNKKLLEIKNILLSKWISKPIDSLDHLEELFKGPYSESYNNTLNGKIIWRGDEVDFDVNIIKSGKRTSAYTDNNFYTLLFSKILPSWKGWPKRDHSIICSTSYRKTEDYGFRYLVFPKNTTKIGICPKGDIWESFKNNFGVLGKITTYTYIFGDIIGYKPKFLNEEEFHLYMKRFYNNISDIRTEIGSHPIEERNFFEFLVKNRGNIIEALDKIFDPNTNKFKLCKTKDFDSNYTGNKELWFDNECIMLRISGDMIDKFPEINRVLNKIF